MNTGTNGPGPSIPLRTSARTSIATPLERKRRSLPASPQKESRRSSNHVSVKPASHEVISSLIDTLSVISPPVQEHFDNLPEFAASVSTPVSPSPWATTFSGVGGGVDGHRTSRLHPERASIRGLDKTARRSPQGVTARASEDEYSIGNVSIEAQPPQPRHSSTSLASAGSDKGGKSLRSIRSLKSLGWRGSKDSSSLRSVPKSPRSPRSPGFPHKQKLDMGDAHERLIIAESRSASPLDPSNSLDIPKRRSSRIPSDLVISPKQAPTPRDSKRLFLNGDDLSDGPNSSKRSSFQLPSQELIPKRNSSIRNSRTFTPIDRKRRSRSAHPGIDEPQDIETAAQEAADADLALLSPDADLSVLSDTSSFKTAPATPAAETTEEEVVRRIKELKDQKEQRTRLSMGDGPDDLAPPSRVRTRTPSPMALPASAPDVPEVPEASKMSGADDSGNNGASSPLQPEEPSAPPPTVRSTPLRTNQIGTITNTALAGNTTLPVAIPRPRSITPSDNNRTSSLTSPQRRNSRLQKRLSTPTSPEAEQKHRRRFSTPVPPIVRLSTFQSDSEHSVDDAVESYLAAPRLSQKVKTQTGRVVAFSEVGDPHGSAIFCCVGMGLTRYLTAFYDELAASLNLRLITPDRPGVGGSEAHADGNDTPLGWPDDVRIICEHLHITKFSILAHSAGAIYALATALRMPQHIRCRVHLLAPWIPPSQMSAIGTHQDPLPSNAVPYSQRLLRSLPTPFLRVANSSWMSFTSNSVTTSLPRSPKQRSKRKDNSRSNTPAAAGVTADPEFSPTPAANGHVPGQEKENIKPPMPRRGTSAFHNITTDSQPDLRAPTTMDQLLASKDAKDNDPDYKNRLTTAIWDAATTNANAAVDLIVCLERKQPIGFRYVDITRAVVIHHGSKDTRVPVENVKWLGNLMKRCEVRILEGEGHGLMASAGVMGNVLEEMSREWEDWLRVVRGRRGGGGGPVSP